MRDFANKSREAEAVAAARRAGSDINGRCRDMYLPLPATIIADRACNTGSRITLHERAPA